MLPYERRQIQISCLPIGRSAILTTRRNPFLPLRCSTSRTISDSKAIRAISGARSSGAGKCTCACWRGAFGILMNLVDLSDTTIIEWQFNSDNTAEPSYKLNSLPGTLIFNAALSAFDLDDIDPLKIDLISQARPAKALGIGSETIVFVMNGVPVIGNDWADYYAIKIQQNGTRLTKYYTLDFDKFPQHPLPVGSKIGYEFGMGCYPETDLEVFDLYFYHDDQDVVEDSFGLEIPTPLNVEKKCHGIYGVTYGKDLKALKLKRYVFPADPLLKYPERI